MDLVVDHGDVVFPATAVTALERAVHDAVGAQEDSIAKLELRLCVLRPATRSWLCAARATFRDGRVTAVEMRGVSATAAALCAVHALVVPLRRAG